MTALSKLKLNHGVLTAFIPFLLQFPVVCTIERSLHHPHINVVVLRNGIDKYQKLKEDCRLFWTFNFALHALKKLKIFWGKKILI